MPVYITTERLLIRNFATTDWKDLLEIAVDKASSQYAVYDHKFPTGKSEVKAITNWFAGGSQYLAVCELSTQKVIGFVCLSGENEKEKDIGYTFHSEYWGKGYGTEACTAAINYAFTVLNLERITSGTANLNYPSVRLLLSLAL